jgi:hypothetical protein
LSKKGVGIVADPKTDAYIAGLPEVDTARLPQGTLFLAQGCIYQVIEVGAGGFHKAREWRKTEATDVALIPGSFPSKFLPVIRRGRLLPVYRTRQELTNKDQPTCFVFPTETLARDAAHLDVDLIQSPGAYVRTHGEEPAFAVTDGVHVFRLYYHRQSASGRKTNLSRLAQRPLPFMPKAHTDGPGYWRLLPSWVEDSPSLDVTQQMKPIHTSTVNLDETIPHIPTITPDPPRDHDSSD